MAHIVLENLVKRFGSQTAVKELNLEIKDREFVSILGPSGCGKTTTMNMISGLLKPDSGNIYFDGRSMTDVPPGKRGVGFMFQNYAVFTHMNVYKNVAFGLLIRKQSREEMDKAVREVTKLLQIDHLLGMNAGKLSINDMQKVALARSIVVKPRIFLLDEPLSNLDAALRSVMRVELKRIQRELGQTSVYVTHDQVEAMSLSDKIAVMNFAVLQQFDTPDNIYSRPKNLFVAKFIGSPTINFFGGHYGEGSIKLRGFSRGILPLSAKRTAGLQDKLRHERVVLGIRPEHVKVSDTEVPGCAPLRAKIVSYEPLGSKTIVYMHPDGDPNLIIKSRMPSGYKPAIGEMKWLSCPEKHFYLFDEVTTDLVERFSDEG